MRAREPSEIGWAPPGPEVRGAEASETSAPLPPTLKVPTVPPSPPRVPSLAVNPQFAQTPIITKACPTGHLLRCLKCSEKLLDSCFSLHHTAEEAELLPRVHASLQSSRSGKPVGIQTNLGPR